MKIEIHFKYVMMLLSILILQIGIDLHIKNMLD